MEASFFFTNFGDLHLLTTWTLIFRFFQDFLVKRYFEVLVKNSKLTYKIDYKIVKLSRVCTVNMAKPMHIFLALGKLCAKLKN